MLRKLFFASLIMMLGLFTVSSCKDDGITNENNEPQPEDIEKADYTVIFWGAAGGVDFSIVRDLYDMLIYRENETIGSNVNFVGTFKTSLAKSDVPMFKGTDKTMYFDLGKKNGCKLSASSDEFANELVSTLDSSYTKDIKVLASVVAANAYKVFFENTNSKEVGDEQYPFYEVDSLSQFIQRTAKTHPAKHFVLVTLGHGNGFDIDADIRTRSCVIDGDLERGLSAQDLAEAVDKSGVHIQTLLCHNCLMSQLENLPYFQQVADYAIISSEETSTRYLPEFVANLSKAGDDLEKMKEASRSTVDYYAKYWTDHKNELDATTSHGFYDLSQTGALMSVVKKIAAWYASAADTDSIFINKVIYNSLYASDMFHIVAKMSKNQFDLFDLRKKYLEMYKPDEFTTWERNDVEQFLKTSIILSKLPMTGGFIFSHIMYQSLRLKNEATAPNLDFDGLQKLYDEYISTLKSMAHIKAACADESISDYAYIFTSPSVCLVPFNSKYQRRGIEQVNMENPYRYEEFVDEFYSAFHSGDLAKVNDLYNKYFVGVSYKTPLDVVMQGYNNTLFDQQTGWSDFLKKLQCIPSVLTTIERKDYVNGVRR